MSGFSVASNVVVFCNGLNRDPDKVHIFTRLVMSLVSPCSPTGPSSIFLPVSPHLQPPIFLAIYVVKKTGCVCSFWDSGSHPGSLRHPVLYFLQTGPWVQRLKVAIKGACWTTSHPPALASGVFPEAASALCVFGCPKLRDHHGMSFPFFLSFFGKF